MCFGSPAPQGFLSFICRGFQGVCILQACRVRKLCISSCCLTLTGMGGAGGGGRSGGVLTDGGLPLTPTSRMHYPHYPWPASLNMGMVMAPEPWQALLKRREIMAFSPPCLFLGDCLSQPLLQLESSAVLSPTCLCWPHCKHTACILTFGGHVCFPHWVLVVTCCHLAPTPTLTLCHTLQVAKHFLPKHAFFHQCHSVSRQVSLACFLLQKSAAQRKQQVVQAHTACTWEWGRATCHSFNHKVHAMPQFCHA